MNYVKTLQDQIQAMLNGFVQHVPNLTISILVLILTWTMAKFAVGIADRLTGNTHMRENLKQLVETLVRLLIWLVGLMIAATISMPGLTPGSLFAGLGVGALAIGFAFQDIFENFLAGVLIMIRDRMRIGDSIVCDKIAGKIERITLRETHIRTATNELNIVPNSMLFKNPVLIETDSPERRFDLLVGVTSGADLEQAARIIRQAVEGIEGLDPNKKVETFAQDFEAGSIRFLVQWWSNNRALDKVIRDTAIRRIKAGLDDAGIDIAGAAPTSVVLEQESAPPTTVRPRRSNAPAEAGA